MATFIKVVAKVKINSSQFVFVTNLARVFS